jgi:hypothetical protein
VQACEAWHFPIDVPDPVEAIKFRMEQSGLTAKACGCKVVSTMTLARPCRSSACVTGAPCCRVPEAARSTSR